jgi:uncharacterized phosphosugar-binding protein
MGNISRRDVFKTGAILAAGAASMGKAGGSEAKAVKPETAQQQQSSWGHTTAFGEEYYTKMLDIFEGIARTQMPVITEVASHMAETVRAGGSVWMQAKQGHMPRFESDPANKGNPRLFQSNGDWDDSDYDKMKPGDMLVTNYINQDVRDARDRGVYVAGVTVCYADSPSTPPGFVKPNTNGWYLADVSNVVIDSHVPYEQGLVTCPEIPEMKICPSSGGALTAILWMLQAEAANKLKNPGAKGSDMAAAVMDAILSRTRQAYAGEKDRIFAAAPVVAEKIVRGAHFHVTSDHGGVQCEATGVAMGPMMTNAFRDKMKQGDVHLLTTIEPDSPKILDEAQKARGLGMYVVAIGPANSVKLKGLADVFFDNLSPEGGGLLEIPGYTEKIATVGGILNNTIMWVFTAQMIDEMVRRGWIPWFWMGFYTVGGEEYDKAVKIYFQRQGF